MLIFSAFCILSLFGFSTALLKPCSIKDSKCQQQWYLDFRKEYATTGNPSLGLPPVDPLQLVTEKVNILGLWTLILSNGTATGIRNCQLPYFKADAVNRTTTLKVVCNNIVVRGNLKLVPSAAVKKSYCYNYSADGNITVDFGQWNVSVQFSYVFVTRDGVKYFKLLFDKGTYNTTLARVTTTVTGVKYRNNDISECANRWIKQNWDLITASVIGERLFDRSEDYFDDIYELLFSIIPANKMFTDV